MNLRPSTLARDDGYTERYLLPTFGRRQVAQITNMHVRAWIAELSARELAPAKVVKAGQIMGKIMRAAVEARLIASSPCDGVALPRVERTEMRFLTSSEVITLAEIIHPRYSALVYLAAYGGLRVGELFGLRAKRLDLLRGRLEMAEVVVNVAGRLHFDPPKTSAGQRTVPLPKVVTAALGEHLARYPAGPDELVFTAPEGGTVRLDLWRKRFWRPAGASPGWSHFARTTSVTPRLPYGSKRVPTRRRLRHAPGTHPSSPCSTATDTASPVPRTA